MNLGKNPGTWKKMFIGIKTPLHFAAVPLWGPEGHIRAERPVGLKIWKTLLNSLLL